MRFSTEQTALACAIALALGGGGVAVYFWQAAQNQTARLAGLQAELADTRQALQQVRQRADLLAAKAAELDTQLGSAKSRATATESRSTQLNRELTSARTHLTARQEREAALLTELETLRQQARAAVAISAPTSAPPGEPTPDVAPLRRRIASLEAQLADLLTRALEEPGPATPSDPPPPPEPVFRVAKIGPGDAFVILDCGSDHGATPGRRATLARGTFAVAEVQISDVRPRFSVAQVLSPLKAQLQPGDIVLLAQ